jgi:hypothetical protein
VLQEGPSDLQFQEVPCHQDDRQYQEVHPFLEVLLLLFLLWDLEARLGLEAQKARWVLPYPVVLGHLALPVGQLHLEIPWVLLVLGVLGFPC